MTDNCPRRQLFVKFANQLDGLREQVLGAAHCIEITLGRVGSAGSGDQRWGHSVTWGHSSAAS